MSDQLLTLFFGLFGGAIKVSTPFMLVALGECLTELSGRINLGLEGTLVMGAVAGYGCTVLTGSPWLGLAAAGGAGLTLGLLHALLCQLPRANDVAIGIALMSFGTALAFFLGKPFIQPQAAHLPLIPLGEWLHLDHPALVAALQINPLFLAGMALAALLSWGLRNTHLGLIVRTCGNSAAAALAIGISVNRVRLACTAGGGLLAGLGGAFLSLSYPGAWSEGLSSGQGLMAVALVVYARWQPSRCVWAALLFGASGALGSSMQAVGWSGGLYLFNAAPYALTFLLMLSEQRRQGRFDAPAELSAGR
jgi:general nucleoside transport system permease protein